MVGKAELVERVATRTGSRAQTAAVVEAVLDELTAVLVSGDRVTLTGFGTFEPVARAARTGRNPRTGAPVEIGASVSARFRPGAGLRAALAGSPEVVGPAAEELAGSPDPEPAAPTSDERTVEGAVTVEPAGKSKGKPAGKSKGKPVSKAKGGAQRDAKVTTAPKAKADRSTTKPARAGTTGGAGKDKKRKKR